jgi:PAS domain S-box-containing protein
MTLKNTPIQQKLVTVMLLTSGAVLLLTCSSFFAYEYVTFRRASVRQLATLGEIIAANSTAALAFDARDDAYEILASLRAERHVVAASLYDQQGNLFAYYPRTMSVNELPPTIGPNGFRFHQGFLIGFKSVVQGERRLGTLYLRSDMGAMYERFRLYGSIALLVIIVACLLAYGLSRLLQKQISQPILALAETARAISDRRDYSVRAAKLGEDELGLLTDALNHMLTQIHEQNQALSESEARVRAVLNSALSAVVVMDSAGKITDWNVRAENMFGWSRGEALGRNVSETVFPPESRKVRNRFMRRFIMGGKAPFLDRLVEMTALHRDGGEFPVELSVSLLHRGDGVAFCGFITDITERKKAEAAIRESEERFRTLANSIPQLAWTARPDGSISWYNQRWYEYTGTTFEEVQDWGWEKVHDPKELQRVVKKFKAAIESGEHWQDTFPLRRHDGEMRWHLSRMVPLRDENNHIVLWFGTNTDITEQRELEQALREAGHRKDEFLATLAHELRNPLAPLRNGLEIMKLAKNDEKLITKSRNMMERQLNQLVRLVDDLLDVSRIRRGRIELRKQRTELTAIVRNALETSQPLIEQAGHKLTLTFPPESIFVDADVTRLSQAFANLLNNAAKYTQPGGHIKLTVQRESGSATVSIKDNGIGIPRNLLPRVFEIFAQADRSLEQSQGGLGIGLSLVKRLVEMHDGAVEAHSEGKGKGSEFIVRLPILSAANTDLLTLDVADIRQDNSQNSCRILVADDNVDAVSSLATMLRMMGHETRSARDGLEAFERAREFHPQIIFLDIGMPKLNGYDACRRIREQSWGRDIFIVALTGWGQVEDKLRSQEAGFNFHLVKPVEPEALQKVFARVVEGEDVKTES